jgi:hypothetical protein
LGSTLEDDAGREHRHGEKHENASHLGACRLSLRLYVGLRRDDAAAAHQHHQRTAEQQRHDAGRNERRAPTIKRRQGRADDGAGADSQAAEDSVPTEHAAAILGMTDQPGGADRVIDRAKEADRGEAAGDLSRSLRQAGRDAGHAAAQEEQRHHVLGTPAIAEPTGRQGCQAVQHEAGHRQPHEVAIRQRELLLERQDDGRIQQHHQMGHRVSDIGEEDRPADGAFVHGGILAANRGYQSLADLKARMEKSEGVEQKLWVPTRLTHDPFEEIAIAFNHGQGFDTGTIVGMERFGALDQAFELLFGGFEDQNRLFRLFDLALPTKNRRRAG